MADLWGMVNTVVLPNCNNCNADVGDGSSGIKGGGGNNDSAGPLPLPPPPPVVLVIVVVFDASSLLPTVAPVNRGILPPLGGDTRWRNGDHGGGLPPMARGGMADVGGGGNPKWITT